MVFVRRLICLHLPVVSFVHVLIYQGFASALRKMLDRGF
jgi:hypothetical protein